MAASYGDETGHYARAYSENLPDYYRYSHGGTSRPYSSGGLYASGGYDQAQIPYYGAANPSHKGLSPEDHEVRASRSRPRSLPPPARRRNRRHRRGDRSPSDSSQDDAPGAEDPIRKAHGIFKTTFSRTSAGVGVAVLGAVLGGLVAREVGDTSSQSKSHGPGGRRSHHDAERARLISTVVGAAVGGFGANALEKRIEVSRVKTAEKEEAWEKKWHGDSKGKRTDRDYDGHEEDRGRRRYDRRSRDGYAW